MKRDKNSERIGTDLGTGIQGRKNRCLWLAGKRRADGKKRDVDILVEFSEPIGLKFFDLIEFLEQKLGRKVDLVSVDAISPYIKPYVEREVVFT